MALIKKQLLAKEDMLLSADNTPVSQARAGTTISVHPVNASVIPFDETRSIAEAIQGVTYTHPLTHPVSIIDGSSNPSKFVKTDALGNTGFDGVAWADIEGKPGTYTPSAHEHSLEEVTSGSLAASRIIVSETRQFITAEQATQLLEMEVKSNKGIPNGYAPLDSNGKINSSFLSDLNLVEVFTPVDLASMLALTSAQPGDIAYRQDNSTSYMLAALPSSTEANWKSLNTGSQIISVNGQTGIVSLNTSDIAETTNLYFTNERVDDRVAALLQAGTNITLAYNDALNTLTISANDTSVNWSEIQSKPTTVSGYGIMDAYTKTESDAAFSLKADLASPTLTGTPMAPTAAVGTNTTQLATTAFVQAEIANDTYSKADVDAKVVHKTGNETIAGVKTFSNNVIFNSNVGIGTNSPIARLHSSVGIGDALALNGDLYKGLSVLSTNTTASIDGGLKIKQVSNGSIVSAIELQGSDNGSGIVLYAGGNVERLRIDTSGSVGIGTPSPIDSLGVKGNVAITSLTGTTASDGSGVLFYRGADNSQMAYTGFSTAGSQFEFVNTKNTGFAFYNGEILQKTAYGLGYGTGSGGTVTQLTSKSTAVTLNKPTGKIVMNNASLASNGVVTFQFFNSSISIIDTVTVNTVAATYSALNSYDVKVEAVGPGYCYITVKNNTEGALSDALGIEFNVTKGSIN